MNNTFSLTRFILLFKKHSLEHAKTYLLSIAVLAGIISLILGFFAYSNHGRLIIPVQATVFIFCLAGAGSVFTSLTFADLGNKRKATGVLTLPASHLEKYMISWLYSFVIFQLIFVGMFYLVDWLVICVSRPPVNFDNHLINILDPEQRAYSGFIIYALFHGFALWGAIFFEKMHFIKTAFVFFIYAIALLLIAEPVLRLIIGEKHLHAAAFGPMFIEGKTFYRILSTNSMDNMSLAVLGLIVIIFWASAFFRLREKEI